MTFAVDWVVPTNYLKTFYSAKFQVDRPMEVEQVIHPFLRKVMWCTKYVGNTASRHAFVRKSAVPIVQLF